ncbi:hypothetical protein VM98_34900, partial [Streptomyces rubellomurinus subsp. indigoferus]
MSAGRDVRVLSHSRTSGAANAGMSRCDKPHRHDPATALPARAGQLTVVVCCDLSYPWSSTE